MLRFLLLCGLGSSWPSGHQVPFLTANPQQKVMGNWARRDRESPLQNNSALPKRSAWIPAGGIPSSKCYFITVQHRRSSIPHGALRSILKPWEMGSILSHLHLGPGKTSLPHHWGPTALLDVWQHHAFDTLGANESFPTMINKVSRDAAKCPLGGKIVLVRVLWGDGQETLGNHSHSPSTGRVLMLDCPPSP